MEALTLPEVRALYAERITDDFSPDELKPLASIEASLQENRYACVGYRADGETLAYAYFFKYESWALLDYYAVRRDLRGKGVGSRFLRDLIASPPDGVKGVLVEVDEPDAAEDAQEREKRERRLRFYLNNGLWDSGVNVLAFGVNYRLLTLPLG